MQECDVKRLDVNLLLIQEEKIVCMPRGMGDACLDMRMPMGR